MAHVCNLSPLHRPPTSSLDRGPVQRRVRRAFIATGKPVLSTSQIVEWSHPRPVSLPKIPSGPEIRCRRENHRMIGGDAHGPALARDVPHRSIQVAPAA
jgi:hypothetical protein